MSKAVTLDLRAIRTFRGRLPKEVQAATLEVAKMVQRDAQARAPHDTGSLGASIYVSARNYTDYEERSGEAEALFQDSKGYGTTPRGRSISSRQTFRMNPLEVPNTNREVLIIAGASYAGYVENGTTVMSAQPFMNPALDTHRAIFVQNIELAVQAAASRLSTRRAR